MGVRPGGISSSTLTSKIAVESQGESARDRRGGHHQDIGLAGSAELCSAGRPGAAVPTWFVAASVVGFFHQLEALHDSEAVLFIHDHQPQFGELHFLLDQRMGSDHQLGVALADVAANFTLAVFLQRSGQQHDPVSGILQNSPRGKIVLLGKNFGGRHQRDLVAIFHGNDGRLESHDGLARSDIALQQPPHGERLLHVLSDFLQHPLLRRRGMERAEFS